MLRNDFIWHSVGKHVKSPHFTFDRTKIIGSQRLRENLVTVSYGTRALTWKETTVFLGDELVLRPSCRCFQNPGQDAFMLLWLTQSSAADLATLRTFISAVTCTSPSSFSFSRPAERSGEDVDIILARLKNVKAFEKFHPSLLQRICLCGFYECLEKGITCRSKHRLWSCHTVYLPPKQFKRISKDVSF